MMVSITPILLRGARRDRRFSSTTALRRSWRPEDRPEHGVVSAEGVQVSAADTGSRRNLTLYTSEEAAAILRVTRSWLERQAAARRVPFTMLGGGYRFTAGHLAQIVDLF